MNILSEHDRGWLEAAIDGEGWLGVGKQRVKNVSKGYTWTVRLGIDNTNRQFVDRVRTILGRGRVHVGRRGRSKFEPRGPAKPLYRIVLTSNVLRDLLPQVRLIIKERRRQLALEALSLITSNQGPGHYSQNDGRLQRIREEMGAK